MTDFLKDSLHTVSQWLLIPTMAILLLLILQSPPVIPPEMANGCVVSADMSMMVIFHLKNFQTHLSVQSVNRARINLSKGKG